MKRLLVVVLVLIILVVGAIGVAVWGKATSWGRSFDLQGANEYCSDLCDKNDKEGFCEREILVDSGSSAARASCGVHATNDRVDSCSEIDCSGGPPSIPNP